MEWPLLRAERTSLRTALMSADDPGRVKTSRRGESAESFSLFSSFDGACQSGSFLIQCNRDKRSTRKFDVGVFTQPGPESDMLPSAILRKRMHFFLRRLALAMALLRLKRPLVVWPISSSTVRIVEAG